MKEAVELIVKALVDNPSQVEVRAVERDARTTLIEVRVAESHMGKVIGRQGTTVRALRTFLGGIGVKHDRRYLLDIIE